MDDHASREVTILLRELASGGGNEDRLFRLVYDHLHRLAAYHMGREAPGNTLQTTALVHEAYIRLVQAGQNWESRAHFFRVAGKVMRQILVDRARARLAGKRGAGAAGVSVNDIEVADDLAEPERIIAVDEALTRLASMDERQCRIVELRFFVGMSIEETADVLNVSARTVKRDWRLARAWLSGELGA